MAERTNSPLRYRQIHLDFHTSEHIPGIGAQFDAKDFVETFKRAHVDSVTIFAKCHHGWSYYPTKVGEPHPQLARPDLMGEMVEALNAADIQCPIYISVQWDERNARINPQWRVRGATKDFDPDQLTAGWHTLCLNHKAYRDELLEQAREVARNYDTPGLFFDIILTPDCVCAECLKTMDEQGLDPANPVDRLKKDEWVNERFRKEMSEALRAEFPGLRIFYNCGHIHKQGPERFASYSHLELESLPTGGWGYDHFPSSARYAAPLGFDFLGQTGKFHTSWGEFGGFKHPHALKYETAQMIALGAKCLVGDQLHPNGAINHDTYASIASAYEHVEALEPFAEGARQVSEIAVLSAEHFHPVGARNNHSDDGAVQMLLELKRTFDVIDSSADFGAYPLIILPDSIAVDSALAERLNAYVGAGGKLILSGRSGLNSAGEFAVDAGVRLAADDVGFEPFYVAAKKALDEDMPQSPFVVYGRAMGIEPLGAEVLGDIRQPYFNRSYKHFSSHQHAPDDPEAAPLGAAVTATDRVGYIAFPIFEIYHAMGQPLYKYVLRGLLQRLLPEALITSDLPSSGRATLTEQSSQNRHVLHLLYGPPQVRGKSVPTADGERLMEMIEDIPALGPISASVKLPRAPVRVYEAVSGEELAWAQTGDGRFSVDLPGLHIHAAVVFENS
ncbi:hypothetical protein GCM10007989_19340 [Devosia pacifica]|uniref:Beta-galactosidase trimerisation domain-containing protein n=1 Tax=Devosia pacifica TaxID=1335967 RepID=A0A918S4B7_9HYPH|nr:beta-galactosidase trimerization domain-containing protein [Devosia pacifica]GHA23870.1 hypothetical protein GCM10007989_19340 [Devosia pacifica]